MWRLGVGDANVRDEVDGEADDDNDAEPLDEAEPPAKPLEGTNRADGDGGDVDDREKRDGPVAQKEDECGERDGEGDCDVTAGLPLIKPVARGRFCEVEVR